MKVVITGAGVISPLGDTAAGFHRSLCEQQPNPRPIEGFDAGEMAGRRAYQVRDFSPQSYLGAANFRPLDRTGQLAASAARNALTAAGWDAVTIANHQVGLVLGTLFCGLGTIMGFDRNTQVAGPKYAKPMDFANTVINAAAGQTALWHKLHGINSTLAGGACSGLMAIGYAADLIRTGRARALLAGGAEELCFESLYGFQSAGLLAEAGREARAVPFGAERNGFVLGEGAAFLVLEDGELARQRGATVLAEVLGWSSGFDPSGGRDQERAAGSVAACLSRAMADARNKHGDIDCVVAAANGSPGADGHEAMALAAAFEGAIPPLTAPKSAFGEALGAAGAFQAITLLESLRTGLLPGTGGFIRQDERLPAIPLSAQTRDLALANGLIHAAGYDGNSCALLLGRAA